MFLYHLLDGDGAGAALDPPSWGFVICKMSTVMPRTGGFVKRTKVKVPPVKSHSRIHSLARPAFTACALHVSKGKQHREEEREFRD